MLQAFANVCNTGFCENKDVRSELMTARRDVPSVLADDSLLWFRLLRAHRSFRNLVVIRSLLRQVDLPIFSIP